MLIPHFGRPNGTDISRQRQDHARRPSCDTAIEGFDQKARRKGKKWHILVDTLGLLLGDAGWP
jgi:hypothetical protein